MRQWQRQSWVLVAVVIICSCGAQVLAGPEYASPSTKSEIEGMIKAHGGMKQWEKAETLSFDNIFFNPAAGQMGWSSPWWVSHEVIDLSTRRVYQDWPLDESVLAYDGKEVWTERWSNSNMPKMQALFFFYFVGLPWLTQDDKVVLGKPGTGRLPGSEDDLTTIRMSFKEKPAVGKTDQDAFVLYIDPKTHLLRGYEYYIGYGAMLDAMGVPEGEVFGPMVRIHDKYVERDGLIFPGEMHTVPPDGSTIYGHHIINNPSLNESFEASRVKKPATAVVDNSSSRRKKQD